MAAPGFIPSAVFLDRDGTIVADVAYMRDPCGMTLLACAAAAIARLNTLRIPVIVVTNQSGIARGLLTEEEYRATERRLDELLAAERAHVDATYFCPHHPDFGAPCDCRKPATGMYRQAARDHAIDLAQAAYVGDRWRDVAPAATLGGVGVMVHGPSSPPEDVERARNEGIRVAGTLCEAVDLLLAHRSPQERAQ